MREKPRILVMYGYHPQEQFAIDVGVYLQRHDLGQNVKVLRYGGERDIPDHVNQWLGEKPIFPNYWKFVKKQGRVDFLVDLHNGAMVKRKEKLAAFITHETRTPDQKVFNSLKGYADSRPYLVAAFYEPGEPYVPPKIEKIEVEFLPPRISVRRGREFATGLVNILSQVTTHAVPEKSGTVGRRGA